MKDQYYYQKNNKRIYTLTILFSFLLSVLLSKNIPSLILWFLFIFIVSFTTVKAFQIHIRNANKYPTGRYNINPVFSGYGVGGFRQINFNYNGSNSNSNHYNQMYSSPTGLNNSSTNNPEHNTKKFCSSCGSNLALNDEFCETCGKKIS